MLDLAEHSNEGPIQLGEIAKRQNISLKYLEQLIIPLKRASLIKSVRGPKGGHILAKSPKEIKMGEIVNVLERGIDLTACTLDPDACARSKSCKTRRLWDMATRAMVEKLNSIALSEVGELD
jgi:Rrf2 family iron-sulfur cluster assembly transcriptional regulator